MESKLLKKEGEIMKNKWGMFIILLFSAITVGLSQLKISAVLGNVAEMLNVDMTKAALLMSLFTVAGIVLSIPGAAVMARTGSKRMLLLLMACLIIGNVLGGLTNSFAVMMFSRIIEGISYAMIITVGIDLINKWFSGAQVGTATGIFNTFAAVANFVAMNGSLMVIKATGNLKSLWWTVAMISVVCFLLVLFFIKVPDTGTEDGTEKKHVSVGEAFRNPALIVTCISMFCLAFVLFGFITCYPQIFTYYGIPKTTANFYSSLNGLFGIPACILCGIIVGKSGKPFTVATIGAIGCILLCLAIPHLGSATYIIHVIASAIFPGGLVMTSMFIFTPQLAKKPELIGLSMGLLNTFYYIGVFASTPVITALTKNNTTWMSASILMTAASVVVLVCSIATGRMNKRKEIAKE